MKFFSFIIIYIMIMPLFSLSHSQTLYPDDSEISANPYNIISKSLVLIKSKKTKLKCVGVASSNNQLIIANSCFSDLTAITGNDEYKVFYYENNKFRNVMRYS